MWIAITIGGLLLLFFLRHMMGHNNTYGVYDLGHCVFSGSKDDCQIWIENKIYEEKQKFAKDIRISLSEEDLKSAKININEELNQFENLCRQGYKIVKIN